MTSSLMRKSPATMAKTFSATETVCVNVSRVKGELVISRQMVYEQPLTQLCPSKCAIEAEIGESYSVIVCNCQQYLSTHTQLRWSVKPCMIQFHCQSIRNHDYNHNYNFHVHISVAQIPTTMQLMQAGCSLHLVYNLF